MYTYKCLYILYLHHCVRLYDSPIHSAQCADMQASDCVDTHGDWLLYPLQLWRNFFQFAASYCTQESLQVETFTVEKCSRILEWCVHACML